MLQKADVIITNPPFSLFREYITQLIEHGNEFLIVGNQNAITYKEVFSLIHDNKVCLGTKSGDMKFVVPSHYELRNTRSWLDENGVNWRSLGNACWFTSFNVRENDYLELTKKYNESEYPKYDNYDAINVDKTKDIPKDYHGVVGVPITFLDKHNQNQFEIVGFRKGDDGKDLKVNGKDKFFRVLIKRKN